MRRRVLAAAIVVVAIVLVSGALIALRSDHSDKVAAAPPPPPTTTTLPPTTTTESTTTTTTEPPPPEAEPPFPCEPQAGPTQHFESAKAKVGSVALYNSPGATQAFDTMSNPTPENVQLAFSVKEHGPDGWLHVQYSQRPNESTAWIHSNDVEVAYVGNRIVIQRGSRRLTVFDGSSCNVLFQAPVGVGVSRTPTPLGDFYMDIVVHLGNSSGVYGPYQLSVAAFSDVLHSFGGGNGQIAIHGTNHPELVGGDVSNGCIRMKNADVTRVAELTTVGSPITIVNT